MPGVIIRNYRELKNFSQKFVAREMGISQNAYSKIENNITQLTVRHLKQLSKILDVPIVDLLKEEFEIHKPVNISKTVSKNDLLERIELLHKKINDKHVQKCDVYVLAMSLLIATENSIALIH